MRGLFDGDRTKGKSKGGDRSSIPESHPKTIKHLSSTDFVRISGTTGLHQRMKIQFIDAISVEVRQHSETKWRWGTEALLPVAVVAMGMQLLGFKALSSRMWNGLCKILLKLPSSVTTSGRMTSTSLLPSKSQANAFHWQNQNSIRNLSGKGV